MQAHPWPLAAGALAVMLICVVPALSMRLDASDAGNDPSNTSTYKAFNLLSDGFGPGLQRAAADRGRVARQEPSTGRGAAAGGRRAHARAWSR